MYSPIYNDIVAMLTTPRHFYKTPASGVCKGRLRQVRHAYHMDVKRLETGRIVAVLPFSKATYAMGRTGGLVRINHPTNKHQRASQKAATIEGV